MNKFIILSFCLLLTGCVTNKPTIINNKSSNTALKIITTTTMVNFYDDKIIEYKNPEFGFSFLYPEHWQKFREEKNNIDIESFFNDPAMQFDENFLDHKDNIIRKSVQIYSADEYQNYTICPENLFSQSGCSVSFSIQPLSEKEYMVLNCYEGSCDLEDLNKTRKEVLKNGIIAVNNNKSSLEEQHNFLNYYNKTIKIFRPDYLITMHLILPVPDSDYYNTTTYNKVIDFDKVFSEHDSPEYNYLKKVSREFDNLLESFKFY